MESFLEITPQHYQFNCKLLNCEASSQGGGGGGVRTKITPDRLSGLLFHFKIIKNVQRLYKLIIQLSIVVSDVVVGVLFLLLWVL